MYVPLCSSNALIKIVRFSLTISGFAYIKGPVADIDCRFLCA